MRIYGIVVWPRLPHSKPKPHVQDLVPNHLPFSFSLTHTLSHCVNYYPVGPDIGHDQCIALTQSAGDTAHPVVVGSVVLNTQGKIESISRPLDHCC